MSQETALPYQTPELYPFSILLNNMCSPYANSYLQSQELADKAFLVQNGYTSRVATMSLDELHDRGRFVSSRMPGIHRVMTDGNELPKRSKAITI